MNTHPELDRILTKIIKYSFCASLIAGVLCLIGFFADPKNAAPSYLISYLFWLGLATGSLPFIAFHALTGGNWGYLTRRFFEMALKMSVLMFILFVPIILNMRELFVWTNLDVVLHDDILRQKMPYLNTPFFLIRYVVFFSIWILYAYFFRKKSLAIDSSNGEKFPGGFQALGASALILYCLSTTFASVDWVMSLDPHWFSTMYGAIFIVGNALSALAFAILLSCVLRAHEPIKNIINPSRLNDLASMLLAFVMLWAYVSLSQFLIIWSGNLQEEAPWYLRRFRGGWHFWSILIVCFHFVVPFLLLLIKKFKRNASILSGITLTILLMRWFDIYWYVKPVFVDHLMVHWMDMAAFFAIGGLWLGVFCFMLKNEPLVFKRDPLLENKAS